jgi:ribose transport system permease protein
MTAVLAKAEGTGVSERRRMSDEALITLLVAGVAIGLFLAASILVPNFFQPLTMLNLVTNNWAIISLGVGVTFLLVSGNFDLSVGGVVALSGVLGVWFAQSADGGNPLSTGLGFP